MGRKTGFEADFAQREKFSVHFFVQVLCYNDIIK